MGSKVLIVDDSQLMNKMIQDILDAAEYETRSALSGEQALQVVDSWNPDMVLLDVMMPDMDGFEVCRRLRKRQDTSTVPIIMVTAKSSISDKQQGFEAGADDYITKPFEPTELKLRLSALLKRSTRLASEQPASSNQLLVVHSMRGGSGCSSLAVNTAIGLKQLWDAPVALVDLARPLGVCCSMLNLQPYHRLDTIVDQKLEEMDSTMVASYLTTHDSDVKLLGGFSDPVCAEKLTENLVSYLLTRLLEMFKYVVVDTSHDFSTPTVAALDLANRVITPVSPDINAARLTQIALKTYSSLGYEESPFLIQNWTFAKQGIPRDQLEKYLGKAFDFVIPYSADAWSKAINLGIPVMCDEEEAPIVKLMEDLVWRISDPDAKTEKPERPTEMWSRLEKRRQASSSQ